MATPEEEVKDPLYAESEQDGGSEHDGTVTNDDDAPFGHNRNGNALRVNTDYSEQNHHVSDPSPSQIREHAMRLDDDLAVLEAERVVSSEQEAKSEKLSLRKTRSRRSEPIDEFDIATNPLHETAAMYRPPEAPNSKLGRIVKKIHNSSFIIRYFTYISPVVLILLVPLLLGALVYKDASVGGVRLLWFSVWLEIVWLTLWAGRIAAKCIPVVLHVVSSMLTNNSKKWRDMGKQLELPATGFFWWLGVEISFLPTMKNHHISGNTATQDWEVTVNKIIISIFVGATLNLVEKIIIQLIAISFHLRTYADRIEINKFQIGSLRKLYAYSREKISETDEDFEIHEEDGGTSGNKTPLHYARDATKVAKRTFNKVGDVAGMVAGDFTGKKINKSGHPHHVVLTLLHTTSGSQVLARRLYRTFVRPGFETVFSGDLKPAFDSNDEAEAAFTMFDKDLNGDISMEELEAVCVEIGRERKSITASLKDLDSVVSKLDGVLFFVVFIITVLVFLSLISTSAAGVLTSAGSTILALSWLFSATAQEFLQSVIFVFVKHPFDVGDRVTIYGNTGALLQGDDYFVKEISLLYTEFKKMEGHVVQAPNSYLNNLFILNQRRSGGLAEAVPIVLKFGTTLEQMDALRQRLLEFVRVEKREYQGNILTELRQVTENFSITLNVIFFYKSNWQNEGLRLQRRNKFICMLMMSLQEIGIEGPRMNLQGAHVNYPLHVSYSGNPPSYTATDNHPHHPGTILEERGSIGETQSISSGTPIKQHHSILRKGSDVAAARARGASLLRPNRHVDFSLGMSNVASSDVMGDVFDNNPQERLGSVVRQANDSKERRIREEEEEQARTTSRERRNSLDSSNIRARGGLMRSRTSMESGNSGLRPSKSSSTRQNRFLGRLGGVREPSSTRDLELGRYGSNEQEPISPKSGDVSRPASRPDTSPFPDAD